MHMGRAHLARRLLAYRTRTPPASGDDLDYTAWRLAAIPGQPAVAGNAVTLRFAAGKVSGSDGCNRFSGGYTIARQESSAAVPTRNVGLLPEKQRNVVRAHRLQILRTAASSNPSIERRPNGVPSSKLRLLPAAPHVER